MMEKIRFEIDPVIPSDKLQIVDFIIRRWASQFVVSKGNIHDISALPGFICKKSGNIIGLVTYSIDGTDCEIVTLDSEQPDHGLGTLLIQHVIDMAKNRKCKRIFLLTTNDNTRAIRFYQRRGFEWIGFHRNAIEESRKLKQNIPELGIDGIPIKHEIEFEYKIYAFD